MAGEFQTRHTSLRLSKSFYPSPLLECTTSSVVATRRVTCCAPNRGLKPTATFRDRYAVSNTTLLIVRWLSGLEPVINIWGSKR